MLRQRRHGDVLVDPQTEIAWIRGSIWFPTRAEARMFLFEHIEVFYNRQRHQTALGHLTPVEFAAQFKA